MNKTDILEHFVLKKVWKRRCEIKLMKLIIKRRSKMRLFKTYFFFVLEIKNPSESRKSSSTNGECFDKNLLTRCLVLYLFSEAACA